MVAVSCIVAGTCLHGSGWSANYLEVGGDDTALLNGVGNTIANCPSFLVPYLSLALRRRFRGSFLPLYPPDPRLTHAPSALLAVFILYTACGTRPGTLCFNKTAAMMEAF